MKAFVGAQTGFRDSPPSCAWRTLPLLLAVLTGIALPACGKSPTEPSGAFEGPSDPQKGLLAPEVVTLSPGDSMTLFVDERDTNGDPYPPGDYEWTTSDSAVVAVSEEGELRAGSKLGRAVVRVQSPSGRTDSVHVWVQPPSGTPSTFRITLEYLNEVPDAWRDELARAAEHWQQVIRRELPAASFDTASITACPALHDLPLRGVERGVRIYVRVSDTFTPGTYAEAVGGPCLHRALPKPTTIFGNIAINRDKLEEGVNPIRLGYLALHEMGHVLGLVGVVQGPQPSWFDIGTERHRGPLALEGHLREFGDRVPFLQTSGAHWEFSGDVMGQGGLGTRISAVSVGALMDMGYPAAWYGGDR